MIFSRAQRWARVGILVWAFVGMRAATADVLFDYTSDSSGYWYEGANWSQGFAPNGALDVVTIDRPTADPTVTYNGTSGTSQIKSLTSSEAIVLSGGTLEILDTANLSGSFSITGGTLKGGQITTTAGIEVNTSGGNTIDSLTLYGDLNLEQSADQVTLTGGLALDGTLNVAGYDARVYFEGTQTLSELSGGTATMMMTGHTWASDYVRVYATGGGVLSIGSGVTVEGRGHLTSSGGSAIHNEGAIHANQGGTLHITSETFVNEAGGTLQVDSGSGLSLGSASWDNQGTLNLDGGTLTLGSNFTTANINQPSLTRAAGSQVILTGNLDNTGAVLDAIGEIHLSGGTITGGTSRVDIHATYDTEEVLDGLTLEGDLKLESDQDQITITGGLVLDGTLDVAGHDAIVYFEGTQTLSELGGGTATMMMTGHTWAPDYVRVYATGGGVLTLGAGVTVEGRGHLNEFGRFGDPQRGDDPRQPGRYALYHFRNVCEPSRRNAAGRFRFGPLTWERQLGQPGDAEFGWWHAHLGEQFYDGQY